MILVTQGHEKSISLEVFLKSYLLLNSFEREKIILFGSIKTLEKNCKFLNFNFKKISDSSVLIENCSLTVHAIDEKSAKTQTTQALDTALDQLMPGDILLTMPSSKDQIHFNDKVCFGHTDYFRKRFGNSNITMLFKNQWENIVLLSDHLPLRDVPATIDKKQVFEKIKSTITSYEKYFSQLNRVILSGLNPHAGESGLLGNEDEVLTQALKDLEQKFPHISFIGPLAADAMHNFCDTKDLKVFCYHDQGLTYFKSKYNFYGSNISLGMPYLRLSVDHGTAFDLYGKNKANYMGCFSTLKECLKQS